jgi:DnaJ homolog subfamily C member 28
MSSRWDSGIEQSIRKLMEEGGFEQLPGAGKPFRWEDDALTPPEQRMANKIMKDNDLAPDWIVQGKTLSRKSDHWRDLLQQAYARYQAAPPDQVAREQAVVIWYAAQDALREEAEKLNKHILSYNLKLPSGINHLPLLNLPHELRRLTSPA